MTASVQGLLTVLFTDPVYGLPLLVWGITGVVWLAWGHGVKPPTLLPYKASRVRSQDPVSSMYWALQERRYSDAILFAYQRLDSAFRQRYGISIRFLPWRRSHLRKLGIGDKRPFERTLRVMVKALDVAMRLEGTPSIKAVAVLLRPSRERKLDRRFAQVMADLSWMLPMLEARA